MKKLVRCKVCGYIMEEGKLGDKCPACGAPRASFMPFTDTISESRRNTLKLDLHPVAVHFPVSFTVAALVFSVGATFLPGEAKSLVVSTAKIIALFLPIVVILAGAVGYIDGKVRFRKIKNSLVLKRKILYASLFLVFALALALVTWIFGVDTILPDVIVIVLAAICLGLVIKLSLLGTSITEAAFPGN